MEDTYFTAQTTDQRSKFKQLIQPIQEMVTEGLVTVDEEGIRMDAADPAMLGLAHFKIALAPRIEEE